MKIRLYSCGGEHDRCVSEIPLGIGYLIANAPSIADVTFVKTRPELTDCDIIGLSSNAWGLQEAVSILNQERLQKGMSPYEGKILHVCLDMSSGRLYLPNLEDPISAGRESTMRSMLDAVKLKTERFTGQLPDAPIVRGDPSRSIRLRQVADFSFAAEFIRREMGQASPEEVREHLELPVVEADLSRMPNVIAKLPRFKHDPSLKGAYVSTLQGDNQDFEIEEAHGKDRRQIFLLSQKTPFILLNTSPQAKTSEADKDRLITVYYKEYMRGEVILKKGDPATSVCEVMQGSAYPERNRSHRYHSGDCFGAAALLTKSRRTCDVIAGSDGTKIAFYNLIELSKSSPQKARKLFSAVMEDTFKVISGLEKSIDRTKREIEREVVRG